jgi:hypothetical protein
VILNKIISGGQTGAEHAALDAAIRLGIPHGGWVCKGRVNKNGIIPYHYQLQEMSTANPFIVAAKNLLESDGTVIFSHGPLLGRARWVSQLAERHAKLWRHIDFERFEPGEAATEIHIWSHYRDIGVLNVTGTEESKDSTIGEWTYWAIRYLIILDAMDAQPGTPPERIKLVDANERLPIWPRTIEQAVDYLEAVLPPDIRFLMAEVGTDAVKHPSQELLGQVSDLLALWHGNYPLLSAAGKYIEREPLSPDEALMVIWGALSERVVETHRLRLVK